MQKIDLDKIAKRQQYKLRGVIMNYQSISTTVGKLLVSKGAGKSKKVFIFTVLGQNIPEIIKLKSGYRIKIWFTIKCNEYKGNWYPELVLQSFEYWPVNDDKIKKEAAMKKMMDDSEYSKSIKPDFGSNTFLDEGFDQNLISK